MARRLLLIAFTAAVALVGSGCSHATIEVRNDTGAEVRVADCVDDSADVAPGNTFTAEGRPEHDALECQIGNGGTMTRCVRIPVSAEETPFRLSRAVVVSRQPIGAMGSISLSSTCG
jgi:hypothetical protein